MFNCIYLNVKVEMCEMLTWSQPTTHMSFSKNRMSSEFSSVLSSTISSANLLPGNSESSAEDLKGSVNQIPMRPRDTHILVWWLCVGSHLPISSTSTEEMPSLSATAAWASLLKWPRLSVWRHDANDGRATGISSHSTERWSYLQTGTLIYSV